MRNSLVSTMVIVAALIMGGQPYLRVAQASDNQAYQDCLDKSSKINGDILASCTSQAQTDFSNCQTQCQQQFQNSNPPNPYGYPNGKSAAIGGALSGATNALAALGISQCVNQCTSQQQDADAKCQDQTQSLATGAVQNCASNYPSN